MVKGRHFDPVHNKFHVLKETCFPVQEAHLKLKTKPDAQKLLRWAKDGLIAANDERIFLDTCREGGKVYTSIEAHARFLSALFGGKEPEEEREGEEPV